ncbi:MAG TPA: nitrate reductase molybdenum cofactor assembly chaperone [Blastocatellia bacterium]|jgi:nitrate reductase delta subunit
MNNHYETLANLLEYPDDGWAARLDAYEQMMDEESVALAPLFLEFRKKIEGASVPALQEKYTQTFDLNPVCTLEVGYHLFGENYKRGLFLANLRETESPYELGQRYQLPDYLPVLLRLLNRLADQELRTALIYECLIPAVDKMVAALSESGNPYSDLMSLVSRTLKIEAPDYRDRGAPETFNGAEAIPELYKISSRAPAR